MNDATLESPEHMTKGFVHRVADVPLQQVQPNRQPRLDEYRYVIKAAWDLRLHRWIRSWWIWESDKKAWRWAWFRRMRFWVFGYKNATYGQYEMARKFLIAVTGGTVSTFEYEARKRTCERCPSLRVILPKSPDGKAKQYCGSCACANWALSELSVKNHLRRWYCPEHRHDGPYPLDWMQEYVRDLQSKVDEIVPPRTNNGKE